MARSFRLSYSPEEMQILLDKIRNGEVIYNKIETKEYTPTGTAMTFVERVPDVSNYAITLELNKVFNIRTDKANVSSITVGFPSSVKAGFVSEINFTTSKSAPSLTITKSDINLMIFGHRTDSYSPSINSIINLIFYYDGLNYFCYISEANKGD